MRFVPVKFNWKTLHISMWRIASMDGYSEEKFGVKLCKSGLSFQHAFKHSNGIVLLRLKACMLNVDERREENFDKLQAEYNIAALFIVITSKLPRSPTNKGSRLLA